MNCVLIEQLFALAQNRLTTEEAEQIHLHLKDCGHACSDQFDKLQQLLNSTACCGLMQPPEWLMHRAMHLFAWHKMKPREESLERIPAILLVDSFAGGRLLGFRGTGVMPRQMLFRAEDYDIDLCIDYTEQNRVVDIMGQAMPLNTTSRAVADTNVKLLKDSIITGETRTNQYGEFIFNGIEEGFYDLKIELEKSVIDITGMDAFYLY
jgi:hypothetical protein